MLLSFLFSHSVCALSLLPTKIGCKRRNRELGIRVVHLESLAESTQGLCQARFVNWNATESPPDPVHREGRRRVEAPFFPSSPWVAFSLALSFSSSLPPFRVLVLLSPRFFRPNWLLVVLGLGLLPLSLSFFPSLFWRCFPQFSRPFLQSFYVLTMPPPGFSHFVRSVIL